MWTRQIDDRDKPLKLFLNAPVSQFQAVIEIKGNIFLWRDDHVLSSIPFLWESRSVETKFPTNNEECKWYWSELLEINLS